MELIAIKESGAPAKSIAAMPPVATEVAHAMTQLYIRVGFEPPWIGYFAVEDATCVGTCGFKSPPQNNRVEIAYFTFPGHEARGVATRMAKELIRIAIEQMPAVTISAQTLPEQNASTSVLQKLKFRRVDIIEHPEDGMVWEWQLADDSEP